MPDFDYARARATAERLLARFGQTGAIRRTTPGSGGDPWDPPAPQQEDFPCTFVVTDYTLRERESTLIGAQDRRAYISTSVAIEPTEQDRLVVGGATALEIQSVSPLAPGGVTLLYEAQVTL